MSTTDYVIDILLILVIFRAVRPHRLTPRAALLPLVLLAVAGIVYLRPVTLGGNDLALILILAAAGIVLGVVSGLADRIWRDRQRRLLSRAGALSVIAWVTGMGFRFGFAHRARPDGLRSGAGPAGGPADPPGPRDTRQRDTRPGAAAAAHGSPQLRCRPLKTKDEGR
jgi:hypothetical protein